MAFTDYYVNDAGSGSGNGDSEANAMSYATFTDYMVTGGSKTAAAGDRFNIKGTITTRTTTNDAWVNGGTATSPVIVRGYNSTIGDLTSLARTNGNGPLVTTNYPSVTYTTGNLSITGTFVILEAMKFTGANATGSVGVVRTTGGGCVVKRCSITNTSTSANAIAGVCGAGANSLFIDSDCSLTGASGGNAAVLVTAASSRLIGCRILGGPAGGVTSVAGVGPLIAFNTIYTSTGNGVFLNNTSGGITVLYNTIVGGGADGINVVTGTTGLNILIGNMITDNAGDGVEMTATTIAAFASNNRFRDNATTYNNAGDWITATSYNDVTTDTGGPETDYVSAGTPNFDYRLIAASPAVDKGSPLYADIGALQRIEVAGGGGMRLAGHGGLAA